MKQELADTLDDPLLCFQVEGKKKKEKSLHFFTSATQRHIWVLVFYAQGAKYT